MPDHNHDNRADERSAGEYADKWSESRRRDPFTKRGPRGYRRSDKRIHEDVGEYLARHGRIDAGRIQVSVDDGEVTLAGIVGTHEEKRLAENVAEACPGVKEIRNKLRVSNEFFDKSESLPF